MTIKKIEYLDMDMDKKVTIGCPIHGYFKQTPRDHLDGHGCPKCDVTILEAGQYYIGDPCYFLSRERYEKLIGPHGHGIAIKEGKKIFLAFNTEMGDGLYEDNRGNEYPVDSGMIALIPVSMSSQNEHGARKMVFRTPVKCFSKRGILHFGRVRINTN